MVMFKAISIISTIIIGAVFAFAIIAACLYLARERRDK